MADDAVRVLAVCDAVLGSIVTGLSLFASYAAATGKATVTTASLIWFVVLFNLALSRLSRRSQYGYLNETVRCVVMLPVVTLLYLSKSGYFVRLWLPAEVMVVGQCVIWGCWTRRAWVGGLITVVFSSAILVAGSVAAGGVDWISVKNALSLAMTGCIMSLLASHLGQSLYGARQRRDEAEEHQRRLSAAFRDLANAQQQLDAVLKCVPGFIVAVNREGIVEFANRAASPFATECRIGTNVLEHVAPRARAEFSARIGAVLGTGEQQALESRLTAEDGSALWYASHFGAMHSGSEVVGAVVISQDVTELKQTQLEVVAAQRLAAVGTLAAGIAHEINTPIQFVSDNTHFLREASVDLFGVLEKLQAVQRLASAAPATPALTGALSEASQAQAVADLAYLTENVPSAFANCSEGLERVATIVRSMKEFAHPAQKDMAPFDLNRAIQNTLTIARNEYKYVADVHTTFAELPPVICHINELNQALLNLIVNAAHAIAQAVEGSENRGTIAVATRLDGADVVISIRDSGTGMPDAVKTRIFEPFFTTKEVGKGTGQGLALVWNIVKERHGGEVTFETRVGEGTTFYLRLPVAGKTEARRSEAARTAA